MKRKFISLLILAVSSPVFSQVGVNTPNPKTTMDVSVKRDASNNIVDNSQKIGLQPPRVSRLELTNNTATYGSDQKGAIIYVTDVLEGDILGNRKFIDKIGYYYFDGTNWQKMTKNIYDSDGTISENRTAQVSTGKYLNFSGGGYVGIGEVDSNAKLNVNGFIQFGGDSHYGVGKMYNDSKGEKYGITQTTYWPETGDARSPGTRIYTSGLPLGHITFGKYTSPTDYTEFGRFSHTEGFFGLNTIASSVSSVATERLDVNGNVRIRTLPVNGAASVLNTGSTGTYTSSKTAFNATRTVVADANGVLGYINGIPSTVTPPSGSINIGETISRVYSVPNATATSNTFNLKTYVTANSLPSLPVIDGLEMNIQGVDATYYDPRIYNVSSTAKLVSYQSFATVGNENETSLNNNLASNSYLQIDANNIVFWTTNAAEVETTNLQVQIDENTYRWYEFKWWCMEVSGTKKIFLSVTRKA